MVLAARAAGFRLRLGGGVALRLRSRSLSFSAPLSLLSDRRPNTCKPMSGKPTFVTVPPNCADRLGEPDNCQTEQGEIHSSARRRLLDLRKRNFLLRRDSCLKLRSCSPTESMHGGAIVLGWVPPFCFVIIVMSSMAGSQLRRHPRTR